MSTETTSAPTLQEVAARLAERKGNDFFGFEITEYLRFLPFDLARPHLKDTAKQSDWDAPPELTRDTVMKMMCDYASFAWDKANNCRGISANRSIMHYIAWTWLAGDRDFSTSIETEFRDNYHAYGKPILRRVCERYGIDWRALDDGRWRDNEADEGSPAPA